MWSAAAFLKATVSYCLFVDWKGNNREHQRHMAVRCECAYCKCMVTAWEEMQKWPQAFPCLLHFAGFCLKFVCVTNKTLARFTNPSCGMKTDGSLNHLLSGFCTAFALKVKKKKKLLLLQAPPQSVELLNRRARTRPLIFTFSNRTPVVLLACWTLCTVTNWCTYKPLLLHFLKSASGL